MWKKTFTSIGIGILTVLVLAGIWGFGIEPRLFLGKEEETATIPDLPPAWENQTVAVVSDFQIGLWMDNDGMVRKAVEEIVEEKPALVLISGDFIYRSPEDPEKEIEHTMDILRPLVDNDLPVYAVLGNHDYAMGRQTDEPNFERAKKIKEALEANGIGVLENEAVSLEPPGGQNSESKNSLHLVGIGAHWPDQDNVDLALSKVPDDMPRLVMMHHPDSFVAFPADTAPLAVAGHTHGGQISVPFTPSWTWMSYYKEDEVHADGWITGYGEPGNALYVNRGIGCSLAPVRINAPPELTLFRLTSSE